MKFRPNQFLYIVFRINHRFGIRRKLGIYESYSGAKNKVNKDKLKTDPESDVIWVIYAYEYQKIIQVI